MTIDSADPVPAKEEHDIEPQGLPALVAEPTRRWLQDLRTAYVLVEEWSSRTSRLQRLRSPNRRLAELVVKVCDRWGEADVRTSFESARRLASVGKPGARVIEFVAWSISPPTLVSEWIGGEDFDAFARRAAVDRFEALRERIASAGALLGHAHRLPIPVAVGAKASRQLGRRTVLSAGDFAVYNFRVDGIDELVYMEPPSKLWMVSAFRDMAWFLVSLDGMVPGRRQRRLLRRAFVHGYRHARPDDSWSVLDELLLRVHLLRRRRGKALRNRRRTIISGRSSG